MQTVNDIHMPEMAEAMKGDTVVRHPENYHFDPEDYLIHLLGRAVANKQDISVVLPSGEGLAIFPTRGDYFSFIEDMQAFCLTGINQFEVKVLNPSEVERFRSADKQEQYARAPSDQTLGSRLLPSALSGPPRSPLAQRTRHAWCLRSLGW